MKFVCKQCGVAISQSLIELKDLSRLVKVEGEDYVPKGYFHIESQMHLGKTKDYFMINIKDLTNSKNHSNYGRLNGCCGLDGHDGMNKTCINDHEIGTECSDCWTLHYIELDPDLVELVEERIPF